MNKINFLVLVLSLSFSQTYSCPTDTDSDTTATEASNSGSTCEYSTICQYHSACYTTLGSTCEEPQTVTISAADRTTILDTHNAIRERVASGKEDKAAQILPGAKMMYKLEWDDELAGIAQKWVNQCVMKHDCSKCRLPLNDRFVYVGQNLAGSGTWPDPKPFNYANMINDRWYDNEIPYVKESYVDKYVFGSDWGHATQVIWGETYSVGCGAILYKYNGGFWYNVLLCNYGPAGNMKDAPMYERANSASDIALGCVTDGIFTSLCVKSAAKTNLYETRNRTLLKATDDNCKKVE